MTNFFSRYVVKRLLSSPLLFKTHGSNVFNFGNVKFEFFKESFLNKQSYCTSDQGLNLDKTVDQVDQTRGSFKLKSIKRVESVFNCTYEEAVTLVDDNHHLLHILGAHSLNKIDRLQDVGINIQTIKENVWLLSFQLGKYSKVLILTSVWII